jgi:hypothetical protein
MNFDLKSWSGCREYAILTDEDGTHWLPGSRHIRCQEHILNLAARHFVDAVAPTPQATLLKKIRHAIDDGDETNIDSLTEQLATLEDDPEAITEDGFDVVNAIGKALALIEQVSLSFVMFKFELFCNENFRFANLHKPGHS